MKKIFFINNFNGLQKKLAIHSKFEFASIANLENKTFVNANIVRHAKCRTRDADALVVRTNCNVDAGMLDMFPSIRLVLRAGHGFDNIDIEECTRRKIYVFNTTGVFTDATADLTVGHMLNAGRFISDANDSMHKKLWDRERFTGIEFSEKKVGIIGLGSVGSAVAKRLIPFGCEILAYDPYKNPNSSHVSKISDIECKLYKSLYINKEINKAIKFVSLNELLEESDFVTLHAPLTNETFHLIDKQQLITMKKNAILINAARGRLINDDALYSALKSDEIRAAAIDTFSEEPATESKLLELDNVFATPHLGSRTSASLERAILKSEFILLNTLINDDYSEALNFQFI